VRHWDEAEHVRQDLAHRLHDGPIQELTAAQLFIEGVVLRLEAEGGDESIQQSLQRGLTALKAATLGCRALMENLGPGIEGEGELALRLARVADPVLPAGEEAIRVPRSLGVLRPELALLLFRAVDELVTWLHQRRETLERVSVDLVGDVLSLSLVTRAHGIFPQLSDPSTLPQGWRNAVARGEVRSSEDGRILTLTLALPLSTAHADVANA